MHPDDNEEVIVDRERYRRLLEQRDALRKAINGLLEHGTLLRDSDDGPNIGVVIEGMDVESARFAGAWQAAIEAVEIKPETGWPSPTFLPPTKGTP